MIKMLGREYNDYMGSTDPAFWPEGAWCDDEMITVDGQDFDFTGSVPADARVTLAGGVFFKTDRDESGSSLEAHFKRWKKAQKTKILTVEFDKSDEEAVRLALGKIKGISKIS